MKFISFLVIFFGLSTALFAQPINNYSSPTSAHQLVAGTNIYLIPPTDFSVSENFTGFQNPEDPTAMIMVTSIPGPFDQISAGFTKEMLASRGMTLNKKQEATVAGIGALYVELDQYSQGLTFTKAILIYGDATETTLINGVSVKDSVALGASIRESVRSAVIGDVTSADPQSRLSFTVDESAGNLQFASVIGNSLLLTRDGKVQTESEDRATLIIDRSYNTQEIEDKEAFTTLRLATLPGKYKAASEEYPRKVELAGMSGYEIFATGADKEETAHLTILFRKEGGYFIFLATYLTGSTQAQADIEAILESFRVK
ncbi:hypothetical protein FUA23_08505 [Neolewinella aurantiaca]|uniref:DUF1795 domain-containing protein n=1 Tax=Neolewinella aurantiaca TaxID=2602767 RepID=A0A5C7FJG7_9BACT|nr:hypothetical protein [Neolewinella aurantiaca]TXF89983.1 hypothetical protein FUA23_08505 [Neolewinella aurantiaca]